MDFGLWAGENFDTFYLFLRQRFIGLTLDLQSFRFILFSKLNLLGMVLGLNGLKLSPLNYLPRYFFRYSKRLEMSPGKFLQTLKILGVCPYYL